MWALFDDKISMQVGHVDCAKFINRDMKTFSIEWMFDIALKSDELECDGASYLFASQGGRGGVK